VREILDALRDESDPPTRLFDRPEPGFRFFLTETTAAGTALAII